MDLVRLINHPELLDRDTLYELRSLLALHPYYQTARLLMLHNLYLLHDPSFDTELRRASVYITDHKVLFNMVEAAHYQLTHQPAKKDAKQPGENRTTALIDNFLDTIPPEEEEEEEEHNGKKGHRKPTPADATVDYVAYLLQYEAETKSTEKAAAPEMKGQTLIDNFLEQEQGRIMLNEKLNDIPQEQDDEDAGQDGNEEEYFTETLARIYIKQGRYQKALDIIERLSNKYPQKNAYFADQIRFLQKLVINSNKNKN